MIVLRVLRVVRESKWTKNSRKNENVRAKCSNKKTEVDMLHFASAELTNRMFRMVVGRDAKWCQRIFLKTG